MSKSDGAALRVALIGTRGVPAAYGGFETAVEEIGQRLVNFGMHVSVYCRNVQDSESKARSYLGMEQVFLPSIKRKSLDTLSHTALASLHSVMRHDRPDVAVVFNAANSPFLPIFRKAGVPTCLHVDGLEWARSKWGGLGKQYYRSAEAMGVRWADTLIADSPGIQKYYREEFGATTELLSYGAPILSDLPSEGIGSVGVRVQDYYLVVARFEPENHVLEIVKGFSQTDSPRQLIVVGAAPYAEAYTSEINRIAALDPRIRLLGGVYDQHLLNSLYFHAYAYLHGHSVGGTNPSLLRAIGAGTAVGAFDVSFNRYVLGDSGVYFADSDQLAALIDGIDRAPSLVASRGRDLRDRAARKFDWDCVSQGYKDLIVKAAEGYSHRDKHRKLRRKRRRYESTRFLPMDSDESGPISGSVLDSP